MVELEEKLTIQNKNNGTLIIADIFSDNYKYNICELSNKMINFFLNHENAFNKSLETSNILEIKKYMQIMKASQSLYEDLKKIVAKLKEKN